MILSTMIRTTQFVRKAGVTPVADTLPGDITDIVLKRIVYLCLFTAVFASLGSLTCLTRSLLGSWNLVEELSKRGVESIVDATAILFSLTVAWLVHKRKFSSRILMRLGLALGVFAAMWIIIGECFGLVRDEFEVLAHISFSSLWIVFLPAMVPIRMRATLIVVLLIAIMPPISRVLLQHMGWVELPAESLLNLTLLMAFSSLMGIAVSHVVYKLGKSVTAAREMGSYTLEESLGGGGMGEVWRASHRMLARPAAVKLIKRDVLAGMDAGEIERLNQRFEQEVQATAALLSPHTVDIYDYGLAQEGTFYYVMELLDGIDMETLVERYGPVEPSRAAYLMTQACHSLIEAHKRHLIHRDIKPANLFVCKYGEDFDFVKVLDFGLVKHEMARDEGDLKLTADGTITGTPSYICPELVTGKSPVDHRSDIYSLGCVMYWLLTGVLVFTAKTSVAMMMEHVNSEPVPPSQRSELQIPKDLDEVVLACLAKDPADRPQSAAELSERLSRIDFEAAWDNEHARSWWDLHRAE